MNQEAINKRIERLEAVALTLYQEATALKEALTEGVSTPSLRKGRPKKYAASIAKSLAKRNLTATKK